MTILKSFDIDALRRQRAARAASGGVDLLAGINQISPDIEKLKVGETAQINIPKGIELRKFVMSVTAKLNNLTPKGGQWEGRTFKVASDPDNGHLYVQRGENVKEPVVRKRGNGGGRPRKAAAETSTTEKVVA